MAILIDPPAWPAHGTLWSHLVSDDSYDELHAFAAHLNVPRRGFDLDHYDVPASMYERAISLGARAVGSKDLARLLRSSGLRVRQVDRLTVAPARRRDYLLTEWKVLGRQLESEIRGEDRHTPDSWLRLGNELIGRYNEPHRAYHDETHLEDVLLSLNHFQTRGERIEHSTLLAAWFHDAVYDGKPGEDEQDSARLAAASLSALGVRTSLVQSVGEMIVATTPATSIETLTTPLTHLLDADLSILGAGDERYERYTRAVRREYSHVPEEAFASGRTRILVAYLEQPAIYRTAAAQQLWEQRARVNLKREIDALQAR